MVSICVDMLSNQRMKLSWRGDRLKGNGSVSIAAAAPRSFMRDSLGSKTITTALPQFQLL
jgi:hypothetical protein